MAIIVDVDDTLLRYGNRPIKRTIDYVNSLDEQIIIITARPVSRRAETVAALRSAGVRFSRIYFKTPRDKDKTTDNYKRDTAQSLKSQMTISMAIDNDASTRRAYASLGIPTKNPASLPQII